MQLSPARTSQLLDEAGAAYRTQVGELLLTALARAFCRWSDERSLSLQVECRARPERLDGVDLRRTVGQFTAAVPVRLTLERGAAATTLDESIRAIKEQLRRLPRSGLVRGALAHLPGPEAWSRLSEAAPLVQFDYLPIEQLASTEFDGLLQATGRLAGYGSGPRAPQPKGMRIEARVLDGELESCARTTPTNTHRAAWMGSCRPGARSWTD